MIRGIIAFLGVLSALMPNKIIHLFERLAIENHTDGTTRSWFAPMVRAEGAVIALVCLLKGKPYAWTMNLTGLFGAIVVFSPELYRKLATTLLYENPEEIKWRDQFTTGVRLIGVLYVLLAAWEFRKRRDDETNGQRRQ